jgi:hypothetical protein
LRGLRLRELLTQSQVVPLLLFSALIVLLPLAMLLTEPAWQLRFGTTSTVDAHVVSVRDGQHCRGSGRRIVYAFVPGQGSEMRGSAFACENSPYYPLAAGDRIPVKYLVSDPYVSAVVGMKGDEMPPGLLVMFAVLIAVALSSTFFANGGSEVWRARRIFARGRITQATVVFVRPRGMRSIYRTGTQAVDVFVSFSSGRGMPQEAIAWCCNDWLLRQLPVGATVHIAYLENKPDQAILLEAFLR